MKNCLALFVAILISSDVVGADLRLRAFWTADSVFPTNEPALVRIIVQIENISDQPVKIITQPTSIGYATHPGAAADPVGVVSLRTFYKRAAGSSRFSVPSEVELKPVLLAPGELSQFIVAVTILRGIAATDISVEYSVESGLARRFGAWSGALVTPVRFTRP